MFPAERPGSLSANVRGSNLKEYSRTKFQALDSRKRWLILADILEHLIGVNARADLSPEAERLLHLLGLYHSFLPEAERAHFPWTDLRNLSYPERSWLERADEIAADLYARAEVDRTDWRLTGWTQDTSPGKRRILPISVLLDRIRSPFNVGSIIRCAEAAGCRNVLLTGYTPGPEHPKVQRTAMDAHRYLPVERIDDPLAEIDTLSRQGYQVVAIETGPDSVPYNRFTFSPPLVLVVGNEELGISQQLLHHCRNRVCIPMRGAKNSLNVSQALAIVLFQAAETLSF